MKEVGEKAGGGVIPRDERRNIEWMVDVCR